MEPVPDQERIALRRSDIARILSPLLLFLAHVGYLVFWSPEPFLKKWLDGSFSFFLALVLCNVVRARVLGAAGRNVDDSLDRDKTGSNDGGAG